MSSYTCDIIITINVTWYMLQCRIGPHQNIAHVCIHDIIWLSVMLHIVNLSDIMAVLVAGKVKLYMFNSSEGSALQSEILPLYPGKTQNGLLNKCASKSILSESCRSPGWKRKSDSTLSSLSVLAIAIHPSWSTISLFMLL